MKSRLFDKSSIIKIMAFNFKSMGLAVFVQALGKRYGELRLEKACKKALHMDVLRYQNVETILKNKLEEVTCHDNITTTLPKHNNIRGADYYR